MDMTFFARQIEQHVPDSKATVSGDGSKFEAVVVSPAFAGLTPIKKHRLVYAALDEHSKSGVLHALSIRAYTPEEWLAQQAG